MKTLDDEIGKSIHIALMNLKSFWERHRAQRWSVTASRPAKARPPRPFQPLTRDESIAVLNDAVEWLMDEARTTLLMPEGQAKELRKAELVRDFHRLIGQQDG